MIYEGCKGVLWVDHGCEHIDVRRRLGSSTNYEWVIPVIYKFLHFFHVHLYPNLKKQSYHFLRLQKYCDYWSLFLHIVDIPMSMWRFVVKTRWQNQSWSHVQNMSCERGDLASCRCAHGWPNLIRVRFEHDIDNAFCGMDMIPIFLLWRLLYTRCFSKQRRVLRYVWHHARALWPRPSLMDRWNTLWRAIFP